MKEDDLHLVLKAIDGQITRCKRAAHLLGKNTVSGQLYLAEARRLERIVKANAITSADLKQD